MSNRAHALALLAGLLVSLGCSRSSSDSGATAPQALADTVICRIESEVNGQLYTAVFQPGTVPAGSGSEPVLAIAGPSSVVTGSTNKVTVTGSTAFDELLVSIEGMDGFYELALPFDVNSLAIYIEIKQAVSGLGGFDCVYTGSDDGQHGPSTLEHVDLIEAGSGDLQINVTWDVESDVDLHVVEPSGEEVYWGNPASASGGQLDVDSNAACTIDGIRSENVFWPSGAAPPGTYTVLVDLWSACTTPQSDFIVTVSRGGQSQTFSGSLSGPGSGGGAGAGQFVTSIVVP